MKYVRKVKYKGLSEQLEAVASDPDSIKYIENPSEAVQLMAVSDFGDCIQFIHNPSEAVQLVAVLEYAYSIRYIHNPSEAVVKYIYTNHRKVFDEFFEEVQE